MNFMKGYTFSVAFFQRSESIISYDTVILSKMPFINAAKSCSVTIAKDSFYGSQLYGTLPTVSIRYLTFKKSRTCVPNLKR